MAALIAGFVLGAARLIAELNKGSLDGMLLGYASMNFLHFALFLFVICSAILIVVSLATPAPAADKVSGLTFATKAPESATSDKTWRRRDQMLSYVLVVCVLGVWWYFRG
jgi:SSS family solute:Na+ symporter